MPFGGIWPPMFMAARIEVSACAHAFRVTAVAFVVYVKSLRAFAVTGNRPGYTDDIGPGLGESYLALNAGAAARFQYG